MEKTDSEKTQTDRYIDSERHRYFVERHRQIDTQIGKDIVKRRRQTDRQ